jgi:hypothetical protein
MEEKKRALIWWDSMNLEEKFYKTIKHNKLIGCDRTRHPDTLTDREIEIIYNAEFVGASNLLLRKQVESEYWICVIGTTNSKNLKSGADSLMRSSVEKAFEETTGHEDKICWSGWGSEKEKVDVLNAVWSMEKDDPLYKSIKRMLKKGGR